MSTRKKFLGSAALLVLLIAVAAATPAFMEKPDPLGGGGWPKSVCFLFCWDGFQCFYGQWDLNKNRTFSDNNLSTGTWNLSGSAFTLTYDGGSAYSGAVTGRAVAGSQTYSTDEGAFSGVLSPAGCSGITAPELGSPFPDGSQ